MSDALSSAVRDESPSVFAFKRASCVAAGTFNIYIIQPGWLAKVGIIPINNMVDLEVGLDRPGFKFTPADRRCTWFVTPSLISIETTHIDENCGEKMSKVLALLPQTPLIAVGNNFYFESPSQFNEDDFTKITGFEPVQKTRHVAYRRDREQYNLQLADVLEHTELHLNIEVRSAEIDVGRATAERFIDHRRTATKLAREALGVEL